MMSRVFVTGSADGLGLMAARLLIADGHEVFLHAARARVETRRYWARLAPRACWWAICPVFVKRGNSPTR